MYEHKAFSSKLSGKGYSSKNATAQCIQVLYIYVLTSKNETSYTIIPSSNLNN